MDLKTDQELLDRYKKRLKKQNDKIKENYERVSAVFPPGTIKRIQALGYSINKIINESVLTFLECAEETSKNSEAPKDNFSEITQDNQIQVTESIAQKEENSSPEEPCEENGFNGLRAADWTPEKHKGRVSYPPQGTSDDATWDSRTQEWYDPLPFD